MYCCAANRRVRGLYCSAAYKRVTGLYCRATDLFSRVSGEPGGEHRVWRLNCCTAE